MVSRSRCSKETGCAVTRMGRALAFLPGLRPLLALQGWLHRGVPQFIGRNTLTESRRFTAVEVWI